MPDRADLLGAVCAACGFVGCTVIAEQAVDQAVDRSFAWCNVCGSMTISNAGRKPYAMRPTNPEAVAHRVTECLHPADAPPWGDNG